MLKTGKKGVKKSQNWNYFCARLYFNWKRRNAGLNGIKKQEFILTEHLAYF